MKKILLLFSLCCSFIIVRAQNSPFYLWGGGLDGSLYQRSALYSDTQVGLLFEAPVYPSGNKAPIEFNWRDGGFPAMLIASNGAVGLGTKLPLGGTYNNGLHISRGGHTSLILGNPINERVGGIVQTSDDRHRLFLGANLYDDPVLNWSNFQAGKGGAGISIVADEGDWGTEIAFFLNRQNGLGSNYAKMVINGDGNVGIGTVSPVDRLEVNGAIRAREIKVAVTGWADYVFEEGYKVRSLESLEMFIKENKRLPEIPGEAEVKAEGIALGEMNVKLLKKIEELTLYLIEQDKKFQTLNSNLSAEVNCLKSELASFKNSTINR